MWTLLRAEDKSARRCHVGGAQVRIMLSVLQFRLNKRYVEADPPFVSIELDQSDSGREGCAVSTLTITSEPADWQGAVQARLQGFCACLYAAECAWFQGS